jgi:hypothetical protein
MFPRGKGKLTIIIKWDLPIWRSPREQVIQEWDSSSDPGPPFLSCGNKENRYGSKYGQSTRSSSISAESPVFSKLNSTIISFTILLKGRLTQGDRRCGTTSTQPDLLGRKAEWQLIPRTIRLSHLHPPIRGKHGLYPYQAFLLLRRTNMGFFGRLYVRTMSK